MKKYLLVGVLVLLFAMPLAASEKESVKIKLPDGVYMYDAHTEQLKSGGVSISFQKFFVVQNNIIYSSREAIKKFGEIKLNELFTENKKYKILLGEEKIGEIHSLRISDSRGPYGHHKTYKQVLFSKDIKQGPAYGRESIYLGRLGSAAKCIAVPEKYNEVKKNVYTTIPKEEVDKIAKLTKEIIYPLVKNNIICKILHEEYLELLDKISDRNGELYIGSYRFVFKRADGKNWTYCDNHIIYSIKNQNVHFIKSRKDEDWMTICGMLDIDGDSKDELIIESTFGGEDGSTTTMEIYKQKADGSWSLIKNIKD